MYYIFIIIAFVILQIISFYNFFEEDEKKELEIKKLKEDNEYLEKKLSLLHSDYVDIKNDRASLLSSLKRLFNHHNNK